MADAVRVPIVGVGASAGGIEALKGFFRGLPADPGFAIVIVTHLGPRRESLLPEIVSRFTPMRVEIVSDGAEVLADRVYVLPADAVVIVRDGRLALRRQGEGRREHHPVDVFLSSLAADRGEHAGGVILSGGGSDGTLGIKAIKARGGITLAQVANGDGPQHPDMPDSAIATGLVDFSIPAHGMGATLVAYARGLSLPEEALIADRGGGPSLDALRAEIYAILRSEVGHDFSGYKTKTFLRRVQRRMQIVQVEDIAGYVARLRGDPPEVAALFRDLLINVTTFFRDGEAFEQFAALVVPKLFEGRGADETIRIWIPGCATGEEVFSIAILMLEHTRALTAAPAVQIFATDIDEPALSVARAGRYPEYLLDGVSEERRRRFFVRDGASFALSRAVRDLCIFSPHSVIRDPPFSQVDLVSCRNLLIYFGLATQNQVLPTFHYALRPGGFLFLGISENLSQFAELFAPVDKKHRIFRRRTDAAVPRMPLLLAGPRPVSPTGDLRGRRGGAGALPLRQAIEAQVLERFAPAYVVVNREGDVVYYSNRTGKYLEAAAGSPTRQILTMARRGLRLDLRAAFREAVETGGRVLREDLVVEGDDGRVQVVTVTIEPLAEQRPEEPLFLVLFADQGPSIDREAALRPSAAAGDGATLHLERELRETRERLQALVEQYETAVEELKSSNEEMVSVNEEMQSTNEELEASKEELQSVNEELHTVNAELNSKVEALDRANTDLQNLFASTEIATVFLDARLVIRSFTPAVTAIFNILPTDRGRPITDFASRLALPDLAEDVALIMRGGETIERRIDIARDQVRYLVRLAPYRTCEGLVEGVVVSFMDVTSLSAAEMRQRVLVAELQHRTRNLLAVVQSIARQTLGTGRAVDTYADRLKALGRVQGLFGGRDGVAIDLGELVRLELRAHGVEEGGRISLSGPAVALDSEYVQTFALALHELATNAVKHGALAQDTAELAITWTVETDPGGGRRLVLDWVERGVRMPDAPAGRGFGRELIEKALHYSLRADTRFELGGDGVVCRIEMPL